MLYPGLYEQVINNALNRELADIPEAWDWLNRL